MMTVPSRAVITLATGKPLYIEMAVNLARSFKHWHPHREIEFYLATDQRQLIPEDLADIHIIDLQPDQYGKGFSPKIHLDEMAPAQQTLFIDADCLCVGSIVPIFERFQGHAVSVVGSPVSTGEWFGDVAAVCQRFGVPAIPKFNGGLYYLEKGELSDRIYQTARELEPQYDDIGLVRLRNRPNDELLMAISMALHGESAIPEDGTLFTDPFACPGPLKVDVLRGGSTLVNPPAPHPLHREWYPWQTVHPTIVHFLGHHTTVYPYTREALRLQLTVGKGWPIALSDLWATVVCTIPQMGAMYLKTLLRPLYRQLFGTRAVPLSERVVTD